MSSEKTLQIIDVFPKQIDYEKGIIVYNIPLSKTNVKDEQVTGTPYAYGFGGLYSGVLNIVS